MKHRNKSNESLKAIPKGMAEYINKDDLLMIGIYKFLDSIIAEFNEKINSMIDGKSYRPAIEKFKQELENHFKTINTALLIDTKDTVKKTEQLTLLKNRHTALCNLYDYIVESLSNNHDEMNVDFIKNANRPSPEQTFYQVENEVKEFISKLAVIVYMKVNEIEASILKTKNKSINDESEKPTGKKNTLTGIKIWDAELNLLHLLWEYLSKSNIISPISDGEFLIHFTEEEQKQNSFTPKINWTSEKYFLTYLFDGLESKGLLSKGYKSKRNALLAKHFTIKGKDTVETEMSTARNYFKELKKNKGHQPPYPNKKTNRKEQTEKYLKKLLLTLSDPKIIKNNTKF